MVGHICQHCIQSLYPHSRWYIDILALNGYSSLIYQRIRGQLQMDKRAVCCSRDRVTWPRYRAGGVPWMLESSNGIARHVHSEAWCEAVSVVRPDERVTKRESYRRLPALKTCHWPTTDGHNCMPSWFTTTPAGEMTTARSFIQSAAIYGVSEARNGWMNCRDESLPTVTKNSNENWLRRLQWRYRWG